MGNVLNSSGPGGVSGQTMMWRAGSDPICLLASARSSRVQAYAVGDDREIGARAIPVVILLRSGTGFNFVVAFAYNILLI